MIYKKSQGQDRHYNIFTSFFKMSIIPNFDGIAQASAEASCLKLQKSSTNNFRAKCYGVLYNIEPCVKLVTVVSANECYIFTDKYGHRDINLPLSSDLATELKKVAALCLKELHRIEPESEDNVTMHYNDTLSLHIGSHLLDNGDNRNTTANSLLRICVVIDSFVVIDKKVHLLRHVSECKVDNDLASSLNGLSLRCDDSVQ